MEFVDILGSGYVIDHCISAFQKDQEEKLYRVYITDCLKVIAENTSKYAGGSYMNMRFFELAYNKPQSMNEKTADEIILQIKDKVEGARYGE